jgi:DNA invertase Pin-like site-specific DNA recombinase
MSPKPQKYIAYYRVSRESQRRSGLGLAAQRQAVQDAAQHPRATIIAEYTETESGKRNDRPELARAIAKARAMRATIIVAKLDRLSRDAAFLLTLANSGLQIRCCDLPDANTLTFGIMASVAQWERERISERTKDALAKTKKPLGTRRPGHLAKINWRKGQRNGLAKAREAAAANRAQERADCYADLGIDAMRRDGLSYAAIAESLNQAGHVTTSGKQFSAMTVHRLLARS